mmetsp:Transcript_48460/g.75677  ORF Transcript_48460/g.75677 Transcript_48460/m.75677 type:complete len:103 (+) Transcript_48460:96-404(+)
MQLSVPDPTVRDGGRQEVTLIKINITLPDGSNEEMEVDKGQTVEYVRAYLHEHLGVPFTASALTFNGRPMVDPMSLVDFGIESGATLTCAVSGAAEADGGEM